jgi:hypothetical protein
VTGLPEVVAGALHGESRWLERELVEIAVARAVYIIAHRWPGASLLTMARQALVPVGP